MVVDLSIHIDKLPINIKDRLDSLERNILENKKNSESPYSKYYSYMYQATHGRAARVTRSEFFTSEVLGL